MQAAESVLANVITITYNDNANTLMDKRVQLQPMRFFY